MLGLANKECDLLEVLIQNARELVTPETLLSRVRGHSNQFRTRTLDVHIRRLRKEARQSQRHPYRYHFQRGEPFGASPHSTSANK